MAINLNLMGQSIRARRTELKMTQKEVAKMANTGQGYIADIEKGNINNISLLKLDKITEALQMDLEKLLSATSNKEEFYITNNEIKTISKIRKLTKEQQIKLGGVIEGMLMSNSNNNNNSEKKGA